MAICGAAALSITAPSGAAAQGLLPALGTGVRLGDMREQFQRAFQTQPPLTTPGWQFTPAIDVLGAWTDNANRYGTGKASSDFYTTVSPSLAIQGNSQRVTANLFIAPQMTRYLSNRTQDSTALNFSGQGHVIVLPDTLFVDLSGYSALQSRAGGLGPTGTAALGRRDQVQTTSLSVSPYLQHRFGGVGLAELGYSLSRTMTETPTGVAPSPFLPPPGTQATLSTSLHAGFTSGEDFGRTNFGWTVVRSDSHGGGTLSGAHRYTETINLGYAVTRTVRVVGSIGHEDVRYGGISPYQVNGITWDMGVVLTPNPDSTIKASYGQHDGRASFSLDATFAPAPRIRLAAQYSEGLSTGQEDLQRALQGADFDASGQPIDHVTGIPLLSGNNFLGTQNALARVRRASLVATLLRDRDVISFNLRRDESSYIPTTTGSVAPQSTSTGISGGVAWQHSFSEALNGNAYLQYGVRDGTGTAAITGGTTSQQTVTASVGVTYLFSPTLSGRAQYSYNGTLGGTGATANGLTQNLVTVGLHKSF